MYVNLIEMYTGQLKKDENVTKIYKFLMKALHLLQEVKQRRMGFL